MPGGDRTGPMGMGPMTGRGAGLCAGFAGPGFGRGGGRGRRNWFYATGLTGWQRAGMGYHGMPYAPSMTRQQELDMLKGQSTYLVDALEEIKKRIGELEKEKQRV